MREWEVRLLRLASEQPSNQFLDLTIERVQLEILHLEEELKHIEEIPTGRLRHKLTALIQSYEQLQKMV